MKPQLRLEHGFAAIAAIFLVVVLAAMGTYMVAFSNTQQITSAQDLQGTRAYWAARAGLEWAVASHMAAGACTAANTVLVIDTFSVNIGCSMATYNDSSGAGGVVVRLFQFTSTATNGASVGGIGFIERSVAGSLER